MPTEKGGGTLTVPADRTFHFLQFGGHSSEPDALLAGEDGHALRVTRETPVLISPFQQLRSVAWRIDEELPKGAAIHFERASKRDAFWDQVITVDPAVLRDSLKFRMMESGSFGATLPARVRSIDTSAEHVQAQRDALDDPVIPSGLNRERPWDELEAAAFPLDFQKVLIASPNDSSPAFAYQNGQWFTTWLSEDLPKWNKEDHWFAPALLIGDELIRPAPLSAKTAFFRAEDGVTTLPCWTLEWSHGAMTVRQEIFSCRASPDDVPKTFVHFRVSGAPAGTKLALGMGRRPNAHWWDEKSRPRTPVPFFTLEPKYRAETRSVIDSAGRVILDSSQPLELATLGPGEMLLTVDCDRDGSAWFRTPQDHTKPDKNAFDAAQGDRAFGAFRQLRTEKLRSAAQVRLPSDEWMRRIDIWRSQLDCITRVKYTGKERLSYGAYFYQYYFGIEEGWPVVALAQWGLADEAKRQAGIMLEAENLAKDNVHHQSRNGAAPTCAAAVARLTNDGAWLESVAPAMQECANWTRAVTTQSDDTRGPLTRGLLPPHIYGGDVRDPATSLYATASCWRGLVATADAFRHVGSPTLRERADQIDHDAAALRARLDDAFKRSIVRDASPPFVPLALELPSLSGKNEGPYDRLTASRLGNYWNLFAPSFLELRYGQADSDHDIDHMVFETVARRGGLWAGLPRFYDGLDAAYAIGNISHLLNRSVRDARFRPQALASLQSFFLHASSRNGYTIPEVAGLFPYRLDRAAYEPLVRESPWSFGMYDAQEYLRGRISFTEPLGAGAGEALTMIRNALVTETLDDRGLPDGGLIFLSAVPADWYSDGNEIALTNMPTAYGLVSLRVRSKLSSQGTCVIDHSFAPFAPARSHEPRAFTVRLITPKGQVHDVQIEAGENRIRLAD